MKNAIVKVKTWDISLSFFLKSVLCGIIMYIAVYMYRKNTSLGIIYGIPLFIFCGFQHCIANIITLGAARTFDYSIFICIIGNFVGSLFVWFISKDILVKETKKKLRKS
jgi:formate/nitrite transporter FocA (FNT family)